MAKRLCIPLVAGVVLLVSGCQMARMFLGRQPLPMALDRVLNWAEPFRTINRYGLFAIMTVSRPEIVVEGSDERLRWLAYEFKCKPGDPTRRPAFVAPHQPRLDWQMWFAALESYGDRVWFPNFLARLLEGSPEVLGLLARNPFPDRPPRYIRAVVYQYRFTDWATRRTTGAWWRREPAGFYSPELTLTPRKGRGT